MAITLHFIEILKRLFQDVPDDIYDEDENSTNITSSLNSINNAIIKIAKNCKDNGGQFIFGEDMIDQFAEQKEVQSNEATGDRIDFLIQRTCDLEFRDEKDNNISGAVGDYLAKFVRRATNDKPEFNPPCTDLFEPLFGDFAKRDDFPVIATYLFCQILFSHFYRKKYNRELSETDRNQLLTNEELDKYQFSLPYEDQVTCSYFVYRYIYLPEEREKLYTEKNKYDCGYRSSKHKIYKFAEVNRIIDELNHSEYPTDKSTEFDTFKKKLVDLNLIQKQGKLSKNQYLLKLFLLTNKIKSRRDVVRAEKTDERYGFDVLKMFKSVHVENFKFDGLPYVTKNGFHSTILISEIKKDLDYVDVVRLTSYCIKSMRYIDYAKDFFLETIPHNQKNDFEHLFNECYGCTIDTPTLSENVLKQVLSLIYIQSIEAAIAVTIDELSYFQENLHIFVSEDMHGCLKVFDHPIKTKLTPEDYQIIFIIIKKIRPELLPLEADAMRMVQKVKRIIDGFISANLSETYNYGGCTLRFMISMVYVCLLVEKHLLPPLPKQKYYHSGQDNKPIDLNALIKSERNSIFKIAFCATIFEGVNKILCGDSEYTQNVDLTIWYFKKIQKGIIPMLKRNPLEGLNNICGMSIKFYDCLLYPSP